MGLSFPRFLAREGKEPIYFAFYGKVFSVFLASFVDVAWEEAEENVKNKYKLQNRHDSRAQKRVNDSYYKISDGQKIIQVVGAVPSVHESGKFLAESEKEVHF